MATYEDEIAKHQALLVTEPGNVNALNDLAVLFAKRRRFGDALELLQKAVAIDPHRATAWANMAATCIDLGKLDDAESCLNRWVELQPNSGKAYRELGRTRRRRNEGQRALEALQRSIELAPEADTYLELGLTYVDLKKEADAKEAYEKALSLDSENANAHNNLGVLLKDMGKLDDAITHLREAVRLRPSSPSDHNNLGVALSDGGHHEEAVQCYRKALSFDPRYVLAWNNLGNTQRCLGNVQEAIEALREAIRLKPDYAEAANNIAIAYLQSGDASRAIEHYNRAISLRPDYAEARMNRALAWLSLGEFKRGWAEYEWRWHLKSLRKRTGGGRRWDGSPLEGRRVLVRYEQGLGDTLQFVRYLTFLKQRGAFVIFEGQPALRQLLSRTAGIDCFAATGESVPKHDFHTMLLSLPGLFETRAETIPTNVPYISTDPELDRAWRERLSSLPGLKVGIAWQGNPQHRGDRQRSVPLEQFESLARVGGVTLVSLQRGHGAEQVERVRGRFALETFEGIDDGDGVDGFLRTAAIVKNLDLVVTVDTAVAHLSGAMGVPTWVALPLAADWRWLRDREDSPWYPSMRLFRRSKDDANWNGVFDRLVDALKEKASQKSAAATSTDTNRLDPGEMKSLLRTVGKRIGAGELDVAKDLVEQVVSADPLNADAHHDLGVVLAKQGQLGRAISCFRRSLELRPNNATAYANLGLAFLQADRIEEAIAHLRKSIFLGGGEADVHNNLGIAQLRLPDPASAVESYMRALYLKPEYAAAHYNLSRALLLQGDFEQGWLEHEWRHECVETRRRFPQPRWTAIPLAGRTILLYGEQGLGDVIQFVRYAGVIKQQGPARVVVECQPELAGILSRGLGVDEVVARGTDLPKFDFHAPLFSLPAILGTTRTTIPTPVPYLSAEPQTVARWRERLSSLPGLKVGIAWQGNPQHRGDRQRSVPLEQFESLARVGGVTLVSLQRGHGAEQVERVRGRFALETFEGIDDGDGVDGFLRTAAIVKNLDLVVTVDTAVAHLSGAMGVPTWVALPLAADWRWLRDREDSPWYPSMRLFRQERANDWREVFARVAQALSAESRKRGPSLESPKHPMDPSEDTTSFKTETQLPETSLSIGHSFVPVRRLLQSQFDVAVVIPTVIRPELRRAVRSIFDQDFSGRVQVLVGVDKAVGDPSLLRELQDACPAHCVMSVLDLGYSTSTRNGGLYPAMPGGALRTVLSYAANSKFVAYLDDDNWFDRSHLRTLRDAIGDNDWAYSLRWYVDQHTGQPLCVDEWESVGLRNGVYAQKLGGFVDPSCMMLNKVICEPVLRKWCFPIADDPLGLSEDRHVFQYLKDRDRVATNGLATTYYTIRTDDAMHAHRLRWIAQSGV